MLISQNDLAFVCSDILDVFYLRLSATLGQVLLDRAAIAEEKEEEQYAAISGG
jgi:hypothetical protein